METTAPRTVRLRASLPVESVVRDFDLELAANETGTPRADDYDVVDEAARKRLDRVLQQLAGVQEELFRWLEADAQHAILFARDPLAALARAVPGFDDAELRGLGDVFRRASPSR